MPNSTLVFDLETVPDLAGFARVSGCEGKSDAEVRELMGDRFPKHIYHAVICIGAALATLTPMGWEITALGAPHVGERSEKELILAFVKKIAEQSPKLVTFNGSAFDLPVLRYRAMVHGISAPGLSERPYFNRYTDDAFDLCDVLSSFGSASPKSSLNEVSRMLGLPGKPADICGADVENMYRDGRIQEIADYCRDDVINTYRVWLRYELFRGKLSQDQFSYSDDAVTRFANRRHQPDLTTGA